MPSFGPELVVPNVTFDGYAHLIYAFAGETDDGGFIFTPAEPIVAGDYLYLFECLETDAQSPMHVRVCDQFEEADGRVRGALEPGMFAGVITVSEQEVAEQGQTILLSVTGAPTVARARRLSVRRIIS